VKLPVAPANLVAERHGSVVDLEFTVPAANTDGTKPANVQRVDVYAYTGPATLPDEQVLKAGTKIASVDVKAPRDPNATVDEDEPEGDVEPPEGAGLDQGAVARVSDDLSTAQANPAEARRYIAVGINKRGRHGPLSKRGAVALADPPATPHAPAVSYDETTITVTWKGPDGFSPQASGLSPLDVEPEARSPKPPADVASSALPATPPALTYNVYDVPASGPPVRLTKKPVSGLSFEDRRIEWGAERCYAVRSIVIVDSLPIESETGERTCKTLKDTFAPKPPKGVTAVASEGSINLIWDANTEADLSGYLVLRGSVDSGSLLAITKTPIQETTFTDSVPAGTRYRYAVEAVDKAGNASAASATVEETSR
jgi:hypothetical protein